MGRFTDKESSGPGDNQLANNSCVQRRNELVVGLNARPYYKESMVVPPSASRVNLPAASELVVPQNSLVNDFRAIDLLENIPVPSDPEEEVSQETNDSFDDVSFDKSAPRSGGDGTKDQSRVSRVQSADLGYYTGEKLQIHTASIEAPQDDKVVDQEQFSLETTTAAKQLAKLKIDLDTWQPSHVHTMPTLPGNEQSLKPADVVLKHVAPTQSELKVNIDDGFLSQYSAEESTQYARKEVFNSYVENGPSAAPYKHEAPLGALVVGTSPPLPMGYFDRSAALSDLSLLCHKPRQRDPMYRKPDYKYFKYLAGD